MDGGVLVVLVVALIVLSPIIWFAWWFLADLDEAANGRRPHAV